MHYLLLIVITHIHIFTQIIASDKGADLKGRMERSGPAVHRSRETAESLD